MEKEQIIAKLKDIVQPYAKNHQAFETMTYETDFINDLQINSANLVDIILDIEEQFDIVIDNESMEKMLNFQAALDIIESKLIEK